MEFSGVGSNNGYYCNHSNHHSHGSQQEHEHGHSHGNHSHQGHSHGNQGLSHGDHSIVVDDVGQDINRGGTEHNVCVDLALKDPTTVNQKDEHGNTVLHRVCKEGHTKLVEKLLGIKGILVNATNNHLECPIHLAGQSGKVELVYMLIQHGADIHGRDEHNKAVTHHSHTSVYILHYLHSHYHMDLDLIDNDLRTPLHYACDVQADDVIKYLIKKKCGIEQADIHGDTALHITTRLANPILCWKILEAGGVNLLHLINREQKTPVDVAKEGTKTEHKLMVGPMKSMYKITDHYYKPCVGLKTKMWFACRLKLYYLASLLLAHVFMPHAQGYLVVPGAIVMVYTVYTDDYRITHISRSPNPVKAGALGLGMLFTLVNFITVITPVLWSVGSLLPWLVGVWCPVLFYTYYVMWISKPGFLNHSISMPNTSSPYTLHDLLETDQLPQAMCRYCLIVPQRPTKHCKLCERCVYRMDHHCQYIVSCIGASNRHLFVLFLTVLAISMSCYIYCSYAYFTVLYPTESLWWCMKTGFLEHSGVLTLTLFNIVYFCMMTFMLCTQLELISKGYTFVFQPHNPTYVCTLTTADRLSNVISFIMGRHQIIKDPLYSV